MDNWTENLSKKLVNGIKLNIKIHEIFYQSKIDHLLIRPLLKCGDVRQLFRVMKLHSSGWKPITSYIIHMYVYTGYT